MERITPANSSLVAVLVILLVIAGVIYLFWQSGIEQIPVDEGDTVVAEEVIPEESVTEEESVDEDVTEEVTEEVT